MMGRSVLGAMVVLSARRRRNLSAGSAITMIALSKLMLDPVIDRIVYAAHSRPNS